MKQRMRRSLRRKAAEREYSRRTGMTFCGDVLYRYEMNRTFETKPFESAAQGARIEAKLRGGPILSIDPPQGTIEYLKDMQPLQLLEVIRRVGLRQRTRRHQKLVIDLNRRRTGENHRALDHVLQFADIARPRVSDESVHHFGTEVQAGSLQFRLKILQKMTGQKRNILRSVPKWRDHDREHVQAIIQVGPESASADGGNQIGIGGRNDAHVHSLRLGASDPIDLPILQDS